MKVHGRANRLLNAVKLTKLLEQPERCNVPVPKRIPQWFWDYANWRRGTGKWKQYGKANRAHIPKNVPKPLPRWVYAEYKRRFVRPKSAPRTVNMGIFAEPGAFSSWAYSSSGWTPASLTQVANNWHLRWVALDAGNTANLHLFDATVKACSDFGIKVGLWAYMPKASDAARICNATNAAFFIAQNEEVGQTEPDYPAKFKQLATNTKLGLVTTLGGFPDPTLDKVGWERYVREWLEVPMLIEAYVAETGATPEGVEYEADKRKLKGRAVVLEANVAHAWKLPEQYDPHLQGVKNYGEARSIYLLETATERDRQWWVSTL